MSSLALLAPPPLATPQPIDSAGVTCKKELLTVELANALINANAANRTVSEEEVARHCRNLLKNRWKFNGDTLCIDRNGRFIDGQHRLHGFLRANEMLIAQGLKPFDMPVFIVRGLDPVVRHTKDIGRKRSLADELRMRGWSDTGNLAAWIRLVWYYDTYKGDLREGAGRGQGTPSIPELLELFDTRLEADTKHVLSVGRTLGEGSRLPASVAMLVVWVLEQVDKADAEFFVEHLGHGDGVSSEGRTNAIYVLRRLITNKRAVKKVKRPAWLWVAWTFVAWGHYRSGQQIENIAFNPGGQQPTRYPTPLATQQQDALY